MFSSVYASSSVLSKCTEGTDCFCWLSACRVVEELLRDRSGGAEGFGIVWPIGGRREAEAVVFWLAEDGFRAGAWVGVWVGARVGTWVGARVCTWVGARVGAFEEAYL